jgi:predicted regulator of Ras-like GTPase activity (Roadblock/LC7/MglB family)
MPTKNRSKEKIENLQDRLEEIKTREGVIGYILRSPNSASIDLKDSTKIIDYAVLSATAFEMGQEISEVFKIGKIGTIVLEGADTKILLARIGDNRLSVFMDKSVDHNKLCEDLDLA